MRNADKDNCDLLSGTHSKFAHDNVKNKAKTQLKASLLMGLESSSTRMVRLANQILLHKKISTPAETTQKIENIQLDSVKNLINQILKSKPTFIGAYAFSENASLNYFDIAYISREIIQYTGCRIIY